MLKSSTETLGPNWFPARDCSELLGDRLAVWVPATEKGEEHQRQNHLRTKPSTMRSTGNRYKSSAPYTVSSMHQRPQREILPMQTPPTFQETVKTSGWFGGHTTWLWLKKHQWHNFSAAETPALHCYSPTAHCCWAAIEFRAHTPTTPWPSARWTLPHGLEPTRKPKGWSLF